MEKSDDDEYYEQMDNYMQEVEANPKLSKKEILQNIINKSKLLKLEKQKLKNNTREKIDILDDNFKEISMLLKKRGRSYDNKFDDFDRNLNTFKYSEKTHPTERVKTENEINLEKQMEIKKRRNKRDENFEDEGDKEDEQIEIKEDSSAKKKLTKRERIEKLIADRIKRSETKEDVNNIVIKKKRRNEDDLADLDEFNNNDNDDDEEIEEEEGGYEDDDGEFDEEGEGDDCEEGEFEDEESGYEDEDLSEENS
jgi:nucleolar protein 14